MMRFFTVIVLLCGISGSAFAGCEGKITGIKATGSLNYSPFNAFDARQTLVLTVENNGSIKCSFQVSVPAGNYPLQFGRKIGFSLSNTAASGSSAEPLTLTTPVLSPGKSTQLPLILTVFRGQATLAGQFTTRVGFMLTAVGAPVESALVDQIAVPLTCTVPPVFEINLAGSGRRTTVQFGNLEAGQNVSVLLQTRTNGDHRLQLQSVHRGFLALKGRSGPAASIPYTAAIDGQPLALRTPVALSFAAAPGQTTRRLTVTIGDTSGKLAGIYHDVITIAILSAM